MTSLRLDLIVYAFYRLLDPRLNRMRPYKISPFYPSWHTHFSQENMSGFSSFFAWDRFTIINKKSHSRNFWKKSFALKMTQMGPKLGFKDYWKIWSLFFSELDLEWKFASFAILLWKSHISKKSYSWNMGRNSVNQLDCKIFK